MRDYELRVTRRALADIDMKSLAGPSFDLEANRESHVILEAFCSKRGNSPVGQERTQGIKAPVYNLHAQDPWRAVTWHDIDEGVVWLLAVTPHNYAEFVARANSGNLQPTTQDYADLEVSRSVIPPAMEEGEVLELIAEEGASLVAAALDTPNLEVRGTLASSLDIGIVAEVIVDGSAGADVYIAFRMPPRPGAALPASLIEACVAAMLPDAWSGDIDWWHESFPGRGREPNEHVVRWRRPAG